MIPKAYIPLIDERVKLTEWTGYTARKLTPWAWFRVEAVNGVQENEHGTRYIGEGAVDAVRLEVLNGDKGTGEYVTVALGELQRPIYWEPVYQIYVQEREQGENIIRWLRTGRGVRVWGSHDLGTAGRMFYTPGDATAPHWSVQSVEIVHDPDRIKVLLVVKHPVPTGEPTGVVHADHWKKAKAEAVKERKKALQEHKALGRKVHNVKDGRCILESWWETYEEISLEGAVG